MREILFKAKRKDNGEWVEGLITVMWGYYHIINPDDENVAYPIDFETICQYTGLTDKNGKKIWENDIVYIPYVHLEDTYCKVIFTFGAFIGELADGTHDSILSRLAEVIGNIFDNPELLEGGETA